MMAMIDRNRVREIVGEPELDDEDVDKLLAHAEALVALFLEDVLGHDGTTPLDLDSVINSNR